MILARVITCSDGVFHGTRQDRSGPAVREILGGAGFDVDAIVVVGPVSLPKRCGASQLRL